MGFSYLTVGRMKRKTSSVWTLSSPKGKWKHKIKRSLIQTKLSSKFHAFPLNPFQYKTTLQSRVSPRDKRELSKNTNTRRHSEYPILREVLLKHDDYGTPLLHRGLLSPTTSVPHSTPDKQDTSTLQPPDWSRLQEILAHGTGHQARLEVAPL